MFRRIFHFLRRAGRAILRALGPLRRKVGTNHGMLAAGSVLILAVAGFYLRADAFAPMAWHSLSIAVTCLLFLGLDRWLLRDWFDLSTADSELRAAAKIGARGFVLGMMLYGAASM